MLVIVIAVLGLCGFLGWMVHRARVETVEIANKLLLAVKAKDVVQYVTAEADLSAIRLREEAIRKEIDQGLPEAKEEKNLVKDAAGNPINLDEYDF